MFQNARKEMRRTADAYSALVKESRAQKVAWETKESALEGELAKLKQQVRLEEESSPRDLRYTNPSASAARAWREIASRPF